MPTVHIVTLVTQLTKLREMLKMTKVPLRSQWKWSTSEELAKAVEIHEPTTRLDNEVKAQIPAKWSNAEKNRIEGDLLEKRENAPWKHEETKQIW